MKKIAVVILNWNGAKLLKEFLPSVVKYSQEGTVYLIDNASTDDSIMVLKQEFPSVKIIQNKENYGFAQGYNEGLQNIEEEIFCLVNSDIAVTENWLTPILSLFESHPNTAIVQPKILDYKKKTHFEYAGAGGGFIDKFGYPYCRGRIFDTIEEDKGQYNDTRQIFWASGACFFIRKDVFQELKGFDADFFAHQEEIDLCWRSFTLNYDTFYCGQSTVYHLGGGTLSNANPRKTFLNFRNSLLMLTKNLPSNKLFFIVVGRMILDGIAGIQFISKGKYKHTISIIKAHFSFYGLLIKTIRKRKVKVKSSYYHTTSIVYNYFVKKCTLFVDKF
ncbi:glycosyltransferase family 2 protein [Flavobacterium piscinae]|uniref:Glycosyltransferase family 2 protein n=1 Tax=Flavobacterium piscinae TaxID=2506424 RepID=A0A4Q1KU64_9FLAO|nr:glycosyltransferase family 2 protein [Flavobacterium piscinae]RXR32644.1 glycosyltransferase family 2 protein [Flavobacterium piscinae]